MIVARNGQILAQCGMVDSVALNLLYKTLSMTRQIRGLDFSPITVEGRRPRFGLKTEYKPRTVLQKTIGSSGKRRQISCCSERKQVLASLEISTFRRVSFR